MMRLDEYASFDATELARLIRGKQVTADEVYDLFVNAVRVVNPQINAMADGPWADPLPFDANGPFGGVPFGLKDLGCHAADVPVRSGSRLSGAGVNVAYESFLVSKFRAAGLAVGALTTTPELGFNTNSEALVYGSTCNPWDLTRSAGGSSGGAGAIVAAGALPMAHASDGGGSIRIPAACNGLVGLKPSRGRTSYGPDHQEILEAFSAEFVVTRTVRDCAASLDLFSGAMPGDKFVVAGPDRPWSREVGANPGRLRVAVRTRAWSDDAVHPEVVAAVESVASQLEAMGHYVEAESPSIDWDRFIAAQMSLFAAGNAEAIRELAKASGLMPSPSTLEATTLACYEYGCRVSTAEIAEARRTVNETVREFGRFYTTCNVLLTPTMNQPPLQLGIQDANDASVDLEAWVRQVFGPCSFTPVFNWTGTPAISLPLGWSGDGLPLGVQLAAGMCQEATLIQLASQLEEAMPWATRRPPVHAATAGDVVPTTDHG